MTKRSRSRALTLICSLLLFASGCSAFEARPSGPEITPRLPNEECFGGQSPSYGHFVPGKVDPGQAHPRHGQASAPDHNLEVFPATGFCKLAAEYKLSPSILATETVEFIPHTGAGKFESYLAMNVPFAPVAALRRNIELSIGRQLRHRGEAHITVITPPEFERLSSHLSIEDLNIIAQENIQSQPFSIDCIGEASRVLNEEFTRTFFLVVNSIGLRDLRQQIAELYQRAGATRPAFVEEFNPHITIGFTHRDLHASDGAEKNYKACVADIDL